MIRRMTLALAALWMLANTAKAQAPDQPPAPDAPVESTVSESVGLSPFFRDSRRFRERHWWGEVDYLFAFVRGSNLPILATTSVPGTPKAIAGIPGATGSSILFGGGWVNDDLRSGIRFGLGCWCNSDQTFGMEAGFTLIESQAALFSLNADNGSILARPFIDARNSTPQAVLVAFPGNSTGSLTIRAGSENFYGAHVDLVEKAIDSDWFRLISLFGYKYYRYDENIRFQQVINGTGGDFVPGTQVFSNDGFSTRNTFHGVDMGFRSQFLWNNLTIDVLTKLAVGRVFRVYDAAGDETTIVPGLPPVVRQGGILALGTNQGVFSSHDWKVVPEAGVTLSWQVRPNVNVRAGYSFIFLNGVARAADQIDTTINPNFFPGNSQTGVLRPSAPHIRSDMWIQSLNLGVQITY
jgi:hypothetical protein